MKNLKKILIIFIGLFFISLPLISLAATDYTLLAPIKGIADQGQTIDLANYVQRGFQIFMGVVAVLAVIMIIIGGIQYLSTDAIFDKKDGKDKITQAIWGLIIVIVAWVLLYTINPNIVCPGGNCVGGSSTTSTPSSTSATPITPATPATETQKNYTVSFKVYVDGNFLKTDVHPNELNTASGIQTRCSDLQKIWTTKPEGQTSTYTTGPCEIVAE